ncbi:hypothetical protein [Planktothrix serta]|nr:hypothetical protein [Planktothrix serta]
MPSQPQPISYIPVSQTLQPRCHRRLTQWGCPPIERQRFDLLEVHFGILKTIILTGETLPTNSLNPARFKARLSHLNLI